MMDDNIPYGPAMSKLNQRQRAFVIAMIEFGGKGYTRAARAAGYKDNPDSPNSIRVHAHNLAHDENIQEAIREEGHKRLSADIIMAAIMAVKTLIDIANDPSARNKYRLKAAEMILNRTGFHAKMEHKVTVTHTEETNEEKIKRIKVIAKRLGLDAEKILGSAVIVDAEHEEIVEKQPRELTKEEKQAAAKHERENELRRIRRKMTPEDLVAHKINMAAEKSARFKAEYRQYNPLQENGDTPDTGSQPDAELSSVT